MLGKLCHSGLWGTESVLKISCKDLFAALESDFPMAPSHLSLSRHE